MTEHGTPLECGRLTNKKGAFTIIYLEVTDFLPSLAEIRDYVFLIPVWMGGPLGDQGHGGSSLLDKEDLPCCTRSEATL